MRNLISYFIKYPVTGNILIFLILALGYMGLSQLNSTLTPQVETGRIQITAVYPGASPQEIEQGIILKIEDNLKGITGIDFIKSSSRENLGTLTVKVISGYDEDLLLQNVKNAVDQISSFPAGMEPPRVSKIEFTAPAIFFSVNGKVDLRTLKQYARKIEHDLRGIDGISKVDLYGFPDEEIEIGFREDDLKSYGMTISEASNAVRAANIDLTGGTIKGEDEELFIRTKQKQYYAKDLKDIVLRSTKDGIVRLSDVADVTDKWEETSAKTELDGAASVVIMVSHTEREDIIHISTEINKYIKSFNENNEVVKTTVLYDLSDEISVMQDILVNNGVVGFFLVIFFLSLFLNRRLSFWVAMGIPLSFMGMFILGGMYGITLNKTSLFGMILVVGILVDDGIVVCENIYQHFERGKSPIRAAIDGTIEVLPAVFSAVLTTIIAFLTFFFIDGMMGQFFVEMAFVVIAALIFSFIECAIILPTHVAHSKALKRGKKGNSFEEKINGFIIRFRDKYFAPLLNKALSYKAVTVAVMFTMLIITVGAYKGGVIKSGDSSMQSEDYTEVTLVMPAGTPGQETYNYLKRISDAIYQTGADYDAKRKDDLKTVKSVQIEQQSSSKGLLRTYLLSGAVRGIHSNDFNKAVRKKVGDIPEAEKLEFVQKSHFGKPISVSLLSYDLEELNEAKDDLKAELNKLSGLVNVVDNNEPGMREVKITLKDKAYMLGLTLQGVMGQVRNGFYGSEVQRINRGQDLVKIWVRYAKEDRSSVGDLENMRIRTNDGSSYPLKEIANMSYERNLTVVNHYNGKREITVEADLASASVNLDEMKQEVDKVILPALMKKHPGLSFHYGGHTEEFKKATGSIMRVIPVILLLLIATIAFTFRSILQAMLILMLLPFGFIGIGWGHWIHGYSLDLPSYLGIVALLGVMVNDSIVLVSAVNDLMRQGKPFLTAVYEGAISRFRAIVMTSLTTIAGLYPLILSTNPQAHMVVPMAISVAYGLLIATVITLLFLPVMLISINNLKRTLKYLRTGVKPSAEEVEMAVKETLVLKENAEAEEVKKKELEPVEMS
jgi:multidrug efflux pump subunit AcrB